MNLLLVLILFLSEPETLRLNLERARNIALDNNPEMVLYREERGSVLDGFFHTLFSCFPQPSLTASYSEVESRPSNGWNFESSGYNAGFQVEQSLFSADKFASLIKSSLELSGSRADYESRKRGFLLRVDGAYLDLLLADEVLVAKERALERALKNEELIREKYRLGSADSLDLLRALVSSSRARLEFEKAKSEKRLREKKLLTLLGLSERYTLLLEDIAAVDFPESIPGVEELLKTCRRERPELQSLRKSYLASRVSLLRSMLSFLPEVKFGWYWNYHGEEFPARFFNEADYSSGFYATLYFNLVDYPFNFKASRRELKRASLNFRKELLSIMEEVEIARDDYMNALREYRIASLLKEQARRAMELARARYEMGGVSLIELFDAETKYNEAVENCLSSYYRLYLAGERLNYVVGKEVIK